MMRLLKTCLPGFGNSKCSLCGGSLYSKRGSNGRKSPLDEIFCSESKCAQLKAILADTSSPNTLTVEINHYHHYNSPMEAAPVNRTELHGESSVINRVELPGEYRYQFSGERKAELLPTIPEKGRPPPVDRSAKPTYQVGKHMTTRM
jgi:hypothetical protein